MILNEKLFNEEILTEKFSDSMPQWLKDRLIYTSRNYRRADGKNINNLNKRSYKNLDKTNQVTDTYGDRSDKTRLFNEFLKKGYDLDSVNVIEGPIPEKRSDPRLKEPNIPIFLLQDDDGKTQVYAKGINEEELGYFDNKYRAFKYTPMKDLLAHCIGFAYIDSSDTSNQNVGEKRADRTAFRNWNNSDSTKSNIRRFRSDELNAAGSVEVGYKYYGVDKSGYIINPDKFKDRLSKLKAKNPQKLLDKLYKKISDIKRDFTQFYSEIDIADMNSSDYDKIFGFNGLNRDLTQVIQKYNRCVQEVENILNSNNSDTWKESELEHLLAYQYGYYQETVRLLSKLEKEAAEYLYVDLDWD